MNKRDVPDWQKLQWNCGDDWAIPLPEYPVDGVFIQARWFIPNQYPVIPTAWLYRLARVEVVSECYPWYHLRRRALSFG